jgi:nucleotide-binding universal stress UspA family protein
MATEKVMCAVDDPTSGLPVVMMARWLANALRAELVVVHTLPDLDAEPEPVFTALEGLLDDTHAQIHLLEGSVAPAILEAAEEENATMLVVGARGRGPVRSALLGSVSRDVASGAMCPVLVVPHDVAEVDPATAVDGRDRYLVCGTDNSDASMAAVAFSAQLAQTLGCRVVVVHARQNLQSLLEYRHPSSDTPPVTGQEDAVAKLVDETMKQASSLAGEGAIEVVEPGAPVKVLKDVADRYDAAMIVVAAGGRGGLSSALLGSVAAELPVTAERPVLVVPRRVTERWAAGKAPAPGNGA